MKSFDTLLSTLKVTPATEYVQTHNYPTRNAQDYSINKTNKTFSDCAVRNCGPSFWNFFLDKTVKHCKTTKHFRNQFYYLNTIIDFILGHVLCILLYFCLFEKCVFFFFFFFQVSVYLLKLLFWA